MQLTVKFADCTVIMGKYLKKTKRLKLFMHIAPFSINRCVRVWRAVIASWCVSELSRAPSMYKQLH